MIRGDLIQLRPEIISAFHFENEGGTDILWDGVSQIRSGEVMLYLGEEIHRFLRMAKVYHPRSGKVGYVNLIHITEVRG